MKTFWMKGIGVVIAALLVIAQAAEAQTLWGSSTQYGMRHSSAKQRHLFGGPVGMQSPAWLGTAPSGSSNDAWLSIMSTPAALEWAIYSTSTDPSLLTGALYTASGVGAVNGTGVTVTEHGDSASHLTVVTFTAVSVATVDAGAAGAHGALKFYDLPAGAIQIEGISYNLTTTAGAGGITDTAALVGSIGSTTVGTDNATLTSTEADVLASTTGTLSGGAGTLKAHSFTDVGMDGTTTAADLYLNIAVPDAGSTADDTVTVAGTITIKWFDAGDY